MSIGEHMTAAEAPEATLTGFLTAQGLAEPGEAACWTPLTGGVSSDLWRVDLPGRSLCVKRALGQLKVAANWQAPLSRNACEYAWIHFAAGHLPANVPRPLAHDPDAGLFAMEYLPPERFPVWKAQLLDGQVEARTAAAVGRVLGLLHAVSADDAVVARAFATDANFHALRIEPYLLATARAHPDLGGVLGRLAERTAGTHLALVHGDVSPKNILVGPAGPVLLDAECAWYGDPAFDLAFCLNHLLLKCLALPTHRAHLRDCADTLAETYLALVGWEPRAQLEARAAALLPALLLARVDGKSPVEYLDAQSRDFVRHAATTMLRSYTSTLADVLDTWHRVLDRYLNSIGRSAPAGA